MKPDNFLFIRRLLKERAGLILGDSKDYLVRTRLAPTVRRLGLDDADQLIEEIRRNPSHPLREEVIEAMVTTETSFFRDVHPFETLQQVILPRLINARENEKQLRFWSAACASGQEIHSLAMLIEEFFPGLRDWKILFLASDFSRSMLKRTRDGLYSQLEVNRGIPARLLLKYFHREGLNWRILPSIRDKISVQQINLTEPLPSLPTMDIVFLRNVLIYFDVQTRHDVLAAIHRLLKPDGYLLIGGVETMIGLGEFFSREVIANTSIYRPQGGGNT